MNKILILTNSYYPKPFANGICIHKVATELKRAGYEVHVQCIGLINGGSTEDMYEGIHIHRIRRGLTGVLKKYGEDNIDKITGKLIYRMTVIMIRVALLLHIPIYPVKSFLFTRRYYKFANKLHSMNNFDVVISSYNPIEACISGLYMKKKQNNFVWVLYILDSLSNANTSSKLPKKITDAAGWKWEKKFFAHSDLILIQKGHESHHKQKRYERFRNKIEIVDLPLFENNILETSNTKSIYDKNYIHLVYTGALYKNIRDPRYLCEMFIKINGNNNYKLHFYSRGSYESVLEEYQKKTNNNIIRHGYVEHEESLNAINRADVLISIGNKDTEMVPSKTFEYISTGKKIIHFFDNENDSSLVYYKKYPLALLINKNESVELNKKKITDFIHSPIQKVDYEDIRYSYIKNTPEYTAELIDKASKDNYI